MGARFLVSIGGAGGLLDDFADIRGAGVGKACAAVQHMIERANITLPVIARYLCCHARLGCRDPNKSGHIPPAFLKYRCNQVTKYYRSMIVDADAVRGASAICR